MFEDEISLLKAYFSMVIMLNPDIVIGYNIFGFDDNYIRQRTNIYKYFDEELQMLELSHSRI